MLLMKKNENTVFAVINAVELIGGEYEYDDPDDNQIIDYLIDFDLIDDKKAKELYKLSEEENSGIYDEYREIIENIIYDVFKDEADV